MYYNFLQFDIFSYLVNVNKGIITKIYGNITSSAGLRCNDVTCIALEVVHNVHVVCNFLFTNKNGLINIMHCNYGTIPSRG